MDHHQRNIAELRRFKEQLSSKDASQKELFVFQAEVEYSTPGVMVKEYMPVALLMNSFEPVIILNYGKPDKGYFINSEDYHLEFNPVFINTKLYYDTDKRRLEIKGIDSPRFKSYQVLIRASD